MTKREKQTITKDDVGVLKIDGEGKPRIVAATGVAVGRAATGSSPLAKIVEEAMVDAVKKCVAEGETDPEIIKAAQLEARRKVLGR